MERIKDENYYLKLVALEHELSNEKLKELRNQCILCESVDEIDSENFYMCGDSERVYILDKDKYFALLEQNIPEEAWNKTFRVFTFKPIEEKEK